MNRQQFYVRATLNRALFINAVNFVPGKNQGMYIKKVDNYDDINSNNKIDNSKLQEIEVTVVDNEDQFSYPIL